MWPPKNFHSVVLKIFWMPYLIYVECANYTGRITTPAVVLRYLALVRDISDSLAGTVSGQTFSSAGMVVSGLKNINEGVHGVITCKCLLGHIACIV